jgi:uracil-DNA glycosylase
VSMGYAAALAAFARTGHSFADLPFFNAEAARVGTLLDARTAQGEIILPAPSQVLNALTLTPLESVRVVILGQDPYPTPGDAHGLSFSIKRPGTLPRSLGNIFKELAADVGAPQRVNGNLTDWVNQGVLLLNTCLTVTAGAAGSHRKLGWEALSDQAISAVSAQSQAVVFILWGADAQTKAPLIDARRHLIISSAHPSPLSARRGFMGSKPFSRSNDWLESQKRSVVVWG